MNLFRIQYILFLLGITCLIIFSLVFFVMKKEWQTTIPYANPFQEVNWTKYYFELQARKQYQKIFGQKKQALFPVNLVVPEKSLKALKTNIPDSTKIWQPGFLKTSDGKLDKIMIRYRGDNAVNWAFEKKSYRVKTRKKEFSGGVRTKEYILPESSEKFDLTKYTVYFLSEKYDLITPKFKLVELYINGENQGIYYEREKIDEGFLRNNNIMPVNIYKGENSNLETKVGIDSSLFINSGLWSKVAILSQKPEKDKEDLDFLLNQLKLFENNLVSPDNFFSKFPIDMWSKFFLTGGHVHAGDIQNQRIISDIWSGYAIPLFTDVVFKDFIFSHDLEKIHSHLEKILNLDPKFIMTKYLNYYQYVFNKKIYEDLANKLEKIKQPLLISAGRDFNYIKRIYEKKAEKTDRNISINNHSLEEDLKSYIKKLRLVTKNHGNYFINEINATWQQEENVLKITINDKLPLGKIIIKYNENLDLENLVIHTLNDNNFFKTQKIPFKVIDKNSISLNATMLSDRIYVFNEDFKTKMASDSYFETRIRPTTFKIYFSENLNISSISGLNLFSKKYQNLNYSNKTGFKPSKNNYLIIDNPDKSYQTLSGNIYFKKTKVFNKKVKIEPGTNIYLGKDVNLIFKNKLIAQGSVSDPIKILPILDKKYWGTFVLMGPESDESHLDNLFFKGGSGGHYENVLFTGMISIHNSKNITLNNIRISGNKIYDDMFHAVYSDNLKINNMYLQNIFSDAVDIDISKNVKISNMIVIGAPNDCLDFMQTQGYVQDSYFYDCKDKGISVGEKSNIKIVNSNFFNNLVGIQSKDKSVTLVHNSHLKNNKIALSAIKKNWRYGGGGQIKVSATKMNKNFKLIQKDEFSNIYIE